MEPCHACLILHGAVPRPHLAAPRHDGANLAGLPGMSIPCGFVKDLPVGLQIVGPHFGEAKILNVAHLFQRETDWHTRVPERYA